MDTQPSPAAPSALCHGCDVSEYSGAGLDLGKLATECDFLVLRATVGDRTTDKLFFPYLHGLVGKDVRLGTYHAFFAHRDPDAQAKGYASVIGISQITLLPMIDFELLHGVDPCEATIRCYACVQAIETETSKPCAVYSYPFFIDMLYQAIMKQKNMDAMNVLTELAKRPLAIAHYQDGNGHPTSPRVPKPWTDWSIWQYRGNVINYGGVVDLDYMKEG